jgi:tetratricopeptide (TPR) repeat protein
VALATKASVMNDRAIEADLKALEAGVAADPDNVELKAALEARRADRLAEQVLEAQRRVDQNPTDPQLRFELGTALYNSGDHSAAIPHLQQATRNPHIRTKVLLTLSRCFKAKNMFDLAIKTSRTPSPTFTRWTTSKRKSFTKKATSMRKWATRRRPWIASSKSTKSTTATATWPTGWNRPTPDLPTALQTAPFPRGARFYFARSVTVEPS